MKHFKQGVGVNPNIGVIMLVNHYLIQLVLKSKLIVFFFCSSYSLAMTTRSKAAAVAASSKIEQLKPAPRTRRKGKILMPF